jgi:hypothetical protein
VQVVGLLGTVIGHFFYWMALWPVAKTESVCVIYIGYPIGAHACGATAVHHRWRSGGTATDTHRVKTLGLEARFEFWLLYRNTSASVLDK